MLPVPTYFARGMEQRSDTREALTLLLLADKDSLETGQGNEVP
jgi:hypothetical protein